MEWEGGLVTYPESKPVGPVGPVATIRAGRTSDTPFNVRTNPTGCIGHGVHATAVG